MRGSGSERLAGLRQVGAWSRVLTVVLLLAALGVLAIIGLALPGSPAWGFDFDAYYSAAQRLMDTGSPYDPATIEARFDLGPVAGLYVYSPLPAQLIAPLAVLDQSTATMAWFLLRLALLGTTCMLLPASTRVKVVAFALAATSMPFVRDLVLGNVSLIVTLLTVIAWRHLDRPIGGTAIGATLFVRPTAGLLLLWWLARRQWRPLTAAVMAVGTLTLISVVLTGFGPYADYLRVLGNIDAVTGVPNNLDLASIAASLGAPAPIVQVAALSSFGLGLGATAWSLRRDREISFIVTSVAVLLVSPLLWDHYLTQLLLPAAFLATRGYWWGLLLLPLTWLPPVLMPLLVLGALVLPFLAPRDRGDSRDIASEDGQGTSALRTTVR